MPTLADLPSETLEHVLRNVAISDLTSCALVSKTWNACVTPLLYGCIDYTWRRPIVLCTEAARHPNVGPCPCEVMERCNPDLHDVAIDSNDPEAWRMQRHIDRLPCLATIANPDVHYPSLYLLVRTVISSPRLARLIYRIKLAGQAPPSVWTSPARTGLCPDDYSFIKPVLELGSDRDRTTWYEELEQGSPCAFAALLLMCIPDLRHFELGPSFQRSLSYLDERCMTSAFSKTQTCSIGAFKETVWMGSGRYPLARAERLPELLLFSYSNLNRISLNVPCPISTSAWSDLNRLPMSPNIVYLELAFTYLNETGLGRLIQACPRLRTLKYDYWTTAPARDPLEPAESRYALDRFSERLVKTRVLEQALRRLHDSLECFHLHIIPPRDLFNQNLKVMSFSNFSHLTTLHVPLQMLVSRDCLGTIESSLPRSLRHIWFNDDATSLWLNHDEFENPYDYDDDDGQNPVDNPEWHPILTDREIIHTIQDFLARGCAHTPYLESLKLLLYPVSYPCWGSRDIQLLKDVLETSQKPASVNVSVLKLHERPCCCHNDSSVAGQGPPYFEIDLLHQSQRREMANQNRNHPTCYK